MKTSKRQSKGVVTEEIGENSTEDCHIGGGGLTLSHLLLDSVTLDGFTGSESPYFFSPI